jgi:hypothetical protein
MDVENTDLERRLLAHERSLTGSHCPYGRSGTEISGPATASIHETPHIGRW